MATKAKRERRELTADEKAAKEQLKAAKFRELGEARISNCLKRLQHVANLSNRSAYAFTQEQADRIVKVLKDAVQRVEDAFAPRGAEQKTFTL